MSVNCNYPWYNCLNGCTDTVSMPILTPTPTPTCSMPKDAPSSKCSYCWHTLNLVWFSAVPAREREAERHREIEWKIARQTGSQTARQAGSQLGRHEFHYKRNLWLDGANWSQPRGKSSGKRILWKSTIGRQLSAAAAQVEDAENQEEEAETRGDAAQTTKTMANERKLKDANEQTRAAKVGSINRRLTQRQGEGGRQEEMANLMKTLHHKQSVALAKI